MGENNHSFLFTPASKGEGEREKTRTALKLPLSRGEEALRTTTTTTTTATEQIANRLFCVPLLFCAKTERVLVVCWFQKIRFRLTQQPPLERKEEMEHLSSATVNAIVKQIKDLQKNPAEGITVRFLVLSLFLFSYSIDRFVAV